MKECLKIEVEGTDLCKSKSKMKWLMLVLSSIALVMSF